MHLQQLYFLPSLKYVFSSDWLMIVAFIASIVLLIALHIKRRESPTNLILLAGFVSRKLLLITYVHIIYLFLDRLLYKPILLASW